MQENSSDDAGAEAAAEAIEAFQRAALDAVRAGRAMLDAAESIVKDPAALDSVVQTMTTIARSAGEAVMGFAAGARGAPPESRPPPDDDEPDGGFERIPVE